MKKILTVLLIIFITFGCGNSVIEKPDNLIDEDVMVDVIYDLSLIESIKSQRPIYLEQNNINPKTYVYKKYKIDSLQFAKSNHYYASDLKRYKNIYEQVSKRLETNKKAADSLMRKNGQSVSAPDLDAPQVR